MLADWRRRAIAATDEMVVDSLLAPARAAAQERPAQAAFGSAAEAEAEEVLAAVSGRRTTFRRRHVLAEARRYLMRTLAGATAPPRAVEGSTEKVLAHAGCLDIAPPGIPPRTPACTGPPAGTSIHRAVGSATCTTRSLLAAGNRLPADV
ncbi:hypothetical protein ACFW24_38255 [Streptomyces nigra]|uniref:hypothetical protein n=1 Tax=Streptomyces nigra TaxID=1827580 RepID=UPI00369D2EE3